MPNRKAWSKQVILQDDYQKVIVNLKQRSMKCSDIEELMGWPHTQSAVQRIYSMIRTIGSAYPVYEPLPGTYKILTDQDLEEYREEVRRKKWLQKIHGAKCPVTY